MGRGELAMVSSFAMNWMSFHSGRVSSVGAVTFA